MGEEMVSEMCGKDIGRLARMGRGKTSSAQAVGVAARSLVSVIECAP